MKKHLLFALCVLLLSAACQSQSSSAPELIENIDNRDFAEMRPGNRNLDELTIAFSKHEIELDFRKSYFVSEAQIFTALYEGLFSYHPFTLEPVPAAVERWELSEDKMQWTFTIRQDARYWNGDPVQAQDFRAAWLSLLEPRRESPYSNFFDVIEGARDFRSGIENDPDKVGILVPSSRTLIIKLSSPASFFPAMLCHHSFSPIHPSMLNRSDWSPQTAGNWTPPMSNGPFRVVSMNDESIVLQKNDQYWDRQNVALNKITIKFTGTADEASRLWNSGEARWISGDVNIESLTDRSGIQVNVMFSTHYYFIRSNERPWNDYRIRRAMALVLPWEEIRGAYLLPAQTLIFPISGYPKVDGITETDYDEAQRLMTEAGFAGGRGLPQLVIRLTPSRDAARVGSLMAAAWRDRLGLDIRIEIIPFERYFQTMREGGYQVGSSTWVGDFADPYAFLLIWRRDSNLNDARLNDSDYEALIERSMIEEGAARLATLAQAEKLLLDRGVVLPVCFNPAINIVDTGEMDGWYPNALDIHPFKYISFKAYRPLPGVVMAR